MSTVSNAELDTVITKHATALTRVVSGGDAISTLASMCRAVASVPHHESGAALLQYSMDLSDQLQAIIKGGIVSVATADDTAGGEAAYSACLESLSTLLDSGELQALAAIQSREMIASSWMDSYPIDGTELSLLVWGDIGEPRHEVLTSVASVKSCAREVLADRDLVELLLEHCNDGESITDAVSRIAASAGIK